MSSNKIAIIGGGNLGSAMAEGMVNSGFAPAERIVVTRRNTARLARLAALGVQTDRSNTKAAAEAALVVLAVKPKHIAAVVQEIAPVLQANQVLVSTATGVCIAEIEALCGAEISVFRAMPNTAAAVAQSVTCLAATNGTQAQRELVEQAFAAIGSTLWIEEELFQAATVLGACGIAYALRFIRAMSQGGIEIGFGAQTAQFIATQTLKGAAELLVKNGSHPEHEIDKVTTPQGCTIAGLNEMEHRGFTSALIKGIVTSYDSISGMKKQAAR